MVTCLRFNAFKNFDYARHRDKKKLFKNKFSGNKIYIHNLQHLKYSQFHFLL